jgi:hypothetical protein
VDLVGKAAYFGFELADDEGMDILVGGAGVEVGGAGLFAQGVEGGDEGRALLGREDAHPFEGAGEGLGAADVAIGEALVERERLGELFKVG